MRRQAGRLRYSNPYEVRKEMNREDYNKIRKSIYSSVMIGRRQQGSWVIRDIEFWRILEAAKGDRSAILATLRQMQADNELADILPSVIRQTKAAAKA